LKLNGVTNLRTCQSVFP